MHKDTIPTPAEPIRTLSLSFDLPIYSRQIPQWRGAFIELAGFADDLFHNHDNAKDGYRYRYPLIQYRMRKGKAAIMAINEGVDALQRVLASTDWKINWEGKPLALKIEGLHMDEHYLRMLAQPKQYKLYKWLALNQENYERWQQCRNLAERSALLENILAGQILGFCTAMGYRLPERLEANLQHLQFMQQVRTFGNPMIAFNVSYDANVLLPAHIGLGRSVSHGFGWQVPENQKNRKPYRAENKEPASEQTSKP
ncbi:MAG: CRISPR-associated endonuclease Cas6 [Lewinellaceae bacterium]|nr:CRISPR-associated endonuclease Cas6 [Lewinellaceae bacterium]